MAKKFYQEQQSEAILLRAFSEGEEFGFTQVFNEYYESLCYYANGFLDSKQESEEVVQQVFVNLWEKREIFPEIQSVKSYLYRSVHNKCVSMLELRKTREKRSAIPLYNNGYEQVHDEYLIRSELLRKLSLILEQVPKPFSEVVYLYYFCQLKIADIAKMLNIPVYTVKSRKARGLAHLRKLLPGYFRLITTLIFSKIFL